MPPGYTGIPAGAETTHMDQRDTDELSVTWVERTASNMLKRVLAHIDSALAGFTRRSIAAIFDIDDTLLFNHTDPMNDSIAPNHTIKTIFNYLKQRGVPVFIVTARQRTHNSYMYAKRQLHALGYKGHMGIFMTPREYSEDGTPARFKYDARAMIHKSHTVILNVGDMITDHIGPKCTLCEPVRPDLYYGISDTTHPETLSVKLPERN